MNWVEKTNTGQWQIFEVNKYAAEVAVVVVVVVVVVAVSWDDQEPMYQTNFRAV